MAIDYIIDLPCRPKRDLGEGDHGRGTEHILDCLKARNRTDLIRELAARDGRRPEGLSITLRVQHADGDAVDRSVTYEELVARGRELEPFESECASCPANVRGRPFGCIGAVNYPIPRRAEEWLMDRLLPTSTFGGELCRRALGDLNYTGEPIRRLREAGFFESPTAVVRILDDSATGLTVTPADRGEVIGQDVRSDAVVNSDQILEAFLGVGDSLRPDHCLMVLLWLGGVSLDGALPRSPEEVRALFALTTPVERAARTAAEVGADSDDGFIHALQTLLRAFHRAWVHDVPLFVSP